MIFKGFNWAGIGAGDDTHEKISKTRFIVNWLYANHLFGFLFLCPFSCYLMTFPRMRFQMSLQIDFLNSCKVTLVAFVWFLSRVIFQMCSQIACMKRCIVALVALVCPFSRVGFHMSPQFACLNRWIVALFAIVCLFTSVSFWICL